MKYTKPFEVPLTREEIEMIIANIKQWVYYKKYENLVFKLEMLLKKY